MQTIRSRSFAAAGAFLATFVSVSAVSPAHAATFDEPAARQVPVSLDGIDLASSQGMAVINRRIRVAAVRACGTADRNSYQVVRVCRRDAIARAMDSLPAAAPQLAAR
jgi:UrcA family protein